MSSITKSLKLEKEMKPIFNKASDKNNLAMITKMEGKLINKLKDTLTDLKLTKKEIEKIEHNVIL